MPVGIDLTGVTLLSGGAVLRWYDGCTGAQRGFCGRCGSSLFYRRSADPRRWSANQGALGKVPPHVRLVGQHFLARKRVCYSVRRETA